MGKSAINLFIFYPICETICFDDIQYLFFLGSLRVINQNRLKMKPLFSCCRVLNIVHLVSETFVII